ncbi:threonylcarbamoyl-AMP synthase, partial [Eubacteriales bacterium OttesenSCG-928-G02]|nr:threonylcarbamoyl-AMP synthase [Eubacteriales bacterium OttesenSCG-928-G02]
DIDQAEEIAYLDDRIRFLIKTFTPGPLTIIAPKKPIIGRIVAGGTQTVGLRFPSNNIARRLIKASGVPVAATSANISTMPSPTNGEKVREYMDGKIDAIIDGGETDIGIESTIIAFTGSDMTFLRVGALSEEEIRNALK